MKILLLFLLTCSTPIMAQQNPTSREEQSAGIDYYLRLGVEFEIKDNPNPNPDLVRSIPFETYNRQRNATIDLEFTDPTTNYIIILYSDEKCKLNKNQ